MSGTSDTALWSLRPALILKAQKLTVAVEVTTGWVTDTDELVTAVLRFTVLWVNTFTGKSWGFVVWMGSWNSCGVLSTLKTVVLSWAVTGVT